MYRPPATAKWKCLYFLPEAKTVINQQDFPLFSKNLLAILSRKCVSLCKMYLNIEPSIVSHERL